MSLSVSDFEYVCSESRYSPVIFQEIYWSSFFKKVIILEGQTMTAGQKKLSDIYGKDGLI